MSTPARVSEENDLFEQLQPLRQQLRSEDSRSRDIAARMGKTGGETQGHGIAERPHDDGNGSRHAMGGGNALSPRHDDLDVQIDEFGRQTR